MTIALTAFKIFERDRIEGIFFCFQHFQSSFSLPSEGMFQSWGVIFQDKSIITIESTHDHKIFIKTAAITETHEE